MARRKATPPSSATPSTRTNERLVMHAVEFELTPDEIAARARDAADTQHEMNECEARFVETKQNHKNHVGALEGRTRDLLRAIRRGTEQRVVECSERKDYRRSIVEYLLDGEVVDERAMEPSERQAELVAMPMPEQPAQPQAAP